MDQSTKQSLVKAIELLKAGKNQEAVSLLATILKHEPELTQGWYMLGLALEDKEKKRRAFGKVLKLDPSHEKATQQLEQLETESLPTAEPEQPPPPFSETTRQDEFSLPDWMKEPSFNPSDYTSELPQISENTDADLPAWAQQNPLEVRGNALLPEEPAAPPQEEHGAEPGPEGFAENELTGYYGDPDDEEAPPINWGDHDDNQNDPPEAVQKPQVTAFFDDQEPEPDKEPAEDEPEWLRDMVEDDGSKKKHKKKEKAPKKLLSPDQKRRRRKIITTIFVVLAIAGLGYAGYTYREQIKPIIDPYWSPVLTQAAPVTNLLTQGAPLTNLLTPDFNVTPTVTRTPPQQPTPEPTWTPSSGQGPISTPGQSGGGAAGPIATPLPLDENILAAMANLEEQVQAVRSLPGPLNLEREILSTDKLRQMMQTKLVDEAALAQQPTDEIVLKALGFIQNDFDLTQAMLNTRGDAVGGFYDPDLNKVNLVGSGFGAIEKYIYAHEYLHAVQDANFDLNSLGLYPTCTKPAQACLAVRALVEGEASLAHQLWLEQVPPEDGPEEMRDYLAPATLFPDTTNPQYFGMQNTFAFEYGLTFVSDLYENGGWNAINRAYANLPDTTEQVIHPDKYLQREQPLFLDHPDLSPVFRNNWEFIRRDSLGEWDTYLLLAYNAYPDAQRPAPEARVAAEGWGADEYRVYYDPVNNDVFLSAFWIWDSAADAKQFHTALLPSISTRFGSTEVDGPGESGECWSLALQTSCLYLNDKWVLWLYSDNQEILEAAKAKFTKFP